MSAWHWSSPSETTRYVKSQEGQAAASICPFKPGTALLTFYSSIETLYSTARHEVDFSHINAIITALGRVWPAAQHSANFQPDQAQARCRTDQ